MKVVKLKPSFVDERGFIVDLLIRPEVGITFVSTKKGFIRGNHYHKKTMQYEYVLKGSFLYFCRKFNGGKTKEVFLKAGDLIHITPGEIHTFKALSHSEILSFNFGPAKGKNAHQDTFKSDNLLEK